MKLCDITVEQLINYQQNNSKLIHRRDLGDLSIMKYTRKAMYGNIWNEFTMQCRGIVVNRQMNELVSYPFTKFFNPFEQYSDHFDSDETVYCINKTNGFLAVISKYNGDLIVSTSGSLEGPYVDYIRNHIDYTTFLNVLENGYTYMFECIEQENFHVCEDKVGLTLLGYRENKFNSIIHHNVETELAPLAEKLHCHVGNTFVGKLSEAEKLVETVDFEGFVVYSESGDRMIKLKSPSYLFKNFVVKLNDKKLNDVNYLKSVYNDIDEEYRQCMKFIIDNHSDFAKLTHDERVLVIKSMFTRNPVAIIMVGVPYSGKTTYLNNRFGKFIKNFTRLSSDDIVHDMCRHLGKSYDEGFGQVIKDANAIYFDRLEQCINQRNNIIIDRTNTSYYGRKQILDKLDNYFVIGIQFECPDNQTLQTRIANRVDQHIPSEVVDRMIAKFEKIRTNEKFNHVLNITNS